MNETPKKLLNSETNCFICSKSEHSKERVRIFGSSAVDIPNLIKLSTDIDVSNYSMSAGFVCLKKCYKHLLKLDKAKTTLEVLKKELKAICSAGDHDRRFKRLHRSTAQDEPQPVTKKQSSCAKSLNFGDAVAEDRAITCTSFPPSGEQCVVQSPNVLPTPFALPYANERRIDPGHFQLVYNPLGFPSASMGLQAFLFHKSRL